MDTVCGAPEVFWMLKQPGPPSLRGEPCKLDALVNKIVFEVDLGLIGRREPGETMGPLRTS